MEKVNQTLVFLEYILNIIEAKILYLIYCPRNQNLSW